MYIVRDFYFYKLYENYVKELKIKAKTNKLFKILLVFYCPRQRVSWSSEADLQYSLCRVPLPGTLLSTTNHLQRKLRHRPVTNHSFCLFTIIWKKDGTASKSPSLIHILPSNFQTWPREFNKLSWGHRVQQWWKMERGHATYRLGGTPAYLDHPSSSFQFYRVEKLYVHMYGYDVTYVWVFSELRDGNHVKC